MHLFTPQDWLSTQLTKNLYNIIKCSITFLFTGQSSMHQPVYCNIHYYDLLKLFSKVVLKHFAGPTYIYIYIYIYTAAYTDSHDSTHFKKLYGDHSFILPFDCQSLYLQAPTISLGDPCWH